MKVATAVLLLVNLLLFGWLTAHQQTDPPNISPGASAVQGTVESLTLLRERSDAAASSSVEAPREPVSLKAADSVVAPTVGEQARFVHTQPPEVLPPTPRPDPGTAEFSAGEPDGGAMSDDEPEGICQTIGPFGTRARAQRMAGALVDLHIEPELRTARIEQPSGYWVYLPSMAGSDAKHIVDELSTRGVKDYFLGRQNFISLGVFSDKNSAERRLREISDLGYRPKLEPRFLVQEVFWIDVVESPGHRVADEQWADLLLDETGVRRQIIRCE